MKHVIFFVLLFVYVFSSCTSLDLATQNPINNKIICIDPGHGGSAAYDSFRVGVHGEREEWINLRVALYLRDMLEEKGATVLLTRDEDVEIPLKKRALIAVENKADLFLSIHHNATADEKVNFPIIYFHGYASENQASVVLGKLMARQLIDKLFEPKTDYSLASDFTIFPTSGTAVLRNTYGIPGVIGEASFFSNPEEERRLQDPRYNKLEAEAYCLAIENYFKSETKPILKKNSRVYVNPFPVFQESERMNKVAKKWFSDFLDGEHLYNTNHPDSLKKAFQLFTRSAKSFPDSYVAKECFSYRSKILVSMGKYNDAKMEKLRVEELYVY